MAVSAGPDIIEDGLVLCLDAGNRRSYPGSGSTWFDISGRGNHVTLYNTPTFSSGNIVFDGVNEYGRTSSTLDLTVTPSITILSAWKTATDTTGVMVYEHTENWNSATAGFGLFTNSDGSNTQTNVMHMQLKGNVSYAGVNVSSPSSSSFQMYSVVHDFSAEGSFDKETKAYVNGAFSTPVSGVYNTNNTNAGFGNEYFYIGSRAGTGAFGNFSMSLLMVYGRALTAQEIAQNFTALRGRFGL